MSQGFGEDVQNEADRLAALDGYCILDTEREAAFDDIVELASVIFAAPIAVVNLVANGRQWFKAEIGIGARELPLDVSICRHAILQRGVFVVPDLSADPRFENNPLVTAAGGLRFYAGALLETPEGLPLGTVCVLDVVPRPEGVTERQARALKALASQTMAQLEARRSQARTRESEERLRLAVENAEVGFWDVDVVNDELIWPPRTKAMFGISPDVPVTMQDFFEGLLPEDREATSEAYAAAADPVRRALYDAEYRTVGKEDGIIRWVAAKGRGVFDAEGRCLRVAGTAVEITARKAAEAKLRESEARLRAVFDQAAAGFARTDLTGRFQEVNDRYCAIAGRSRDELLTLRMQDITHPDDLVPNSPLFETTVAKGSSFDIEKRYVRPDSSVVWVRNSVSAVREAGADESILAVTIDISARKQAEEALRALNDTLESQVAERTAERDRMWNTSPDLMLVIDFEGFFRRVNPAWTALLGYTPDELVGHHVNEFVLPEDHAPTVQAYELAADGGRPSIVNRYRHKDGSTRWIAWAAAPAVDMTYATGRDVTAEKRREAELTAAQEALRQSQKMEAMGQLTGGVAHDFNNLLTPIIGSLDMLVRRGVGSERERRLIDGALQSAERAKTLVQRLLAFARRQPLQPVSVEIPRLVNGMVELISSTLGPTIDVRVALAPDLPMAKADPNQLEMALLNLAVNARDAMPAGGELIIEGRWETLHQPHTSGMRPAEYVLLRVIDSGTGMDEETRQRAVEPFFSTKGIGKGTGLGLSMVHGLAAQLGGGLTIESTPGGGTAIELWLPISAAPAGVEEAAAAAPTGRVGRGIALLVDDEALVRMSTADMLIDLGFEVIEAESAADALRLISSDKAPDLLVTDHLMPGMNGAELAREIRAVKPALPVLIVSGYAEMEGIPPELARLTKPFRNAELAASIAALLPNGLD